MKRVGMERAGTITYTRTTTRTTREMDKGDHLEMRLHNILIMNSE